MVGRISADGVLLLNPIIFTLIVLTVINNSNYNLIDHDSTYTVLLLANNLYRCFYHDGSIDH